MKNTLLARVLGVLGLAALAITLVTFLFGNTQFVLGTLVLAAVCIAGALAFGESGGVKRFFTGRAVHFAFFTAVSALLVVAVLAAANYVAYKKPKSWDLTKNRIWTLSEDTRKTLGRLSSDVKVLAFYGQADAGYQDAQDLLRRYGDQSKHFTWQLVDPYKSPELVKRYAITEGGPRLVVLTGPSLDVDAGKAKDPTEQALTNALVKATRAGTRKIYFTEGHGEPAPRGEGEAGLSAAVKALEGEGFEVGTLSLLEKAEVPADAAAVMVVAPRKAFLDPEVRALRTYASKGGHVGLFVEPEVSSGLDPLMKDWGIEADEDMVVDPNPVARLFGGSPVTPIVRPAARHEITKDLAQVGIVLPTARSLVALTASKVTPTPIALTGPTAWGETDIKSLYGKGAKHDPGEKGGPLPVAMAAEKPTASEEGKRSDEARVVVVGDGEFFQNKYQQLLANLDFFLNTASWLSEQEDRITIRPRSRDASRLFLTEAQVSGVKFVTIVGLPFTLLGLGLAVWVVRRSR